jgi:hypothetical protein
MSVFKRNMALVLVLSAALAAPSMALADRTYAANDRGSEYDGYCYQATESSGKGHPVTGAVVGAAVGSQVSKHERGLGALGGAIIGGAIGNNVGKHKDSGCLNGDYYSFEGAYYDPAPAPDGYAVVFFRTRPSSDVYSRVHYNGQSRNDDNRPYGYNDRGYSSPHNW